MRLAPMNWLPLPPLPHQAFRTKRTIWSWLSCSLISSPISRSLWWSAKDIWECFQHVIFCFFFFPDKFAPPWPLYHLPLPIYHHHHHIHNPLHHILSNLDIHIHHHYHHHHYQLAILITHIIPLYLFSHHHNFFGQPLVRDHHHSPWYLYP